MAARLSATSPWQSRIELCCLLLIARKINALRDYTLNISQGKKTTLPKSSNDELTVLVKVMQTMRNELDGKQYVQTNGSI